MAPYDRLADLLSRYLKVQTFLPVGALLECASHEDGRDTVETCLVKSNYRVWHRLRHAMPRSSTFLSRPDASVVVFDDRHCDTARLHLSILSQRVYSAVGRIFVRRTSTNPRRVPHCQRKTNSNSCSLLIHAHLRQSTQLASVCQILTKPQQS